VEAGFDMESEGEAMKPKFISAWRWSGQIVMRTGMVGKIDSFHFMDRDQVLLKYGDKRQRRRIRRQMKVVKS